MTDRDRTTREEATRDAIDRQYNREERANQAEATRPGVDAKHGGPPGAEEARSGGSVFQPNRTDLDDIDSGRTRTARGGSVEAEDPSAYVQQGHEIQNRTGRAAVKDSASGTAARGLEGTRDTSQAGGGGSEFQPLAKDPHAGVHFDDSAHRPGGTSPDQQDLSRRGRDWREDDELRGDLPPADRRRP